MGGHTKTRCVTWLYNNQTTPHTDLFRLNKTEFLKWILHTSTVISRFKSACKKLSQFATLRCYDPNLNHNMALRLLAQHGGDLASTGMLVFERHHPFLRDCLDQLPGSYLPRKWGSIGPHLASKVLLFRCGTRSVVSLVGKTCGGVTVLPYRHFLPVHYKQWRLFFEPAESRRAWRMLRDSYVMHVFNKESSNTRATPGSAYEQAGRMNCPRSWNLSMHLYGSF